ncbi:Mrp/NBP35 family ATP-binding protein [Magnetococcales bacterium HHB-1]
MSDMLRQQVVELFNHVQEPKLKWNINTLNLLKSVELEGNTLKVLVHLVTGDGAQIQAFRQMVLEGLKVLHPNGEVELTIKRVMVGIEGIDGVKHVIMVASGKGGVGKSTVAVNMAAALAQQGFKVGLMDADIYGPSIPHMLGEHGQPEVAGEEQLLPLKKHGLQFISAGSLIEQGKALDWRGPLVSGMIVQFIRQTIWGEQDFLIIDMPPGTGDIHLTTASKLQVNGVVMVAMPQDVVWGDVRRSIDLLQKQKIPLLGVVENMSYTRCEKCGHHTHPFVQGSQTEKAHIPLLAKLPLAQEISQSSDDGTPLVLQQKDSELAKAYHQLAQAVVQTIKS